MCKLFGLKIYTKGQEELLNEIKKRKEKIHVVSGNAEVLKYPLKDNKIFTMYNSNNTFIIPDGISVYLPVKKRKTKDIKKITGIDLMQNILKDCESTGKKVYFLGAKNEIINKMIKNIKKDYPNLNIAGFHHGYIDIDNCKDIISEINDSKPYALFVAMGTPIQENFILKYMDELKCSLFMGVGGSFDVLSGEIPRCPQIYRKIGLEWLYRITKDPSKISRIWNNLFFTINALLKG